ncbi:MAG: cupredoxin domain-containing protein [Bdellovibrionota bacterium]
MRQKTGFNLRFFWITAVLIAGLCLFRVVSVAAYDDVEGDAVEVYASEESEGDEDAAEEELGKPEIRLSRPEEAASRIADMGYDQVPGSEYLRDSESQNALIVPVREGRKIASTGLPTHSAPARETLGQSQAPYPTLEAEVIEPRAVSAGETRAHVIESQQRRTLASSVRGQESQYGLHSEPKPNTKIDPPVPPNTAHTGVQEVSVIVSDYGYFPQRIFVTQNVPVRLYLTTPSKNTLCLMSDGLNVKKGVAPGKVEEVRFIPEQPGDYKFYCPVKSIEGMITVREMPVAEPSTRGLASEPGREIASQAGQQPDSERGEDQPAARPPGYNEPKNATRLRSLIED